MKVEPFRAGEPTIEGRIAARVDQINHRISKIPVLPGNSPMQADFADYREGLRLYLQLEVLTALRDEARKIASLEAIRKGRALLLESRELELQREIDVVNAKIAELEAS
jgi:hypothetical protein